MPLPRPSAHDRILTAVELIRAGIAVADEAQALDDLLDRLGIGDLIAVPNVPAPVGRADLARDLLEAVDRLSNLEDRGLPYLDDTDRPAAGRLEQYDAELEAAQLDADSLLTALAAAT